MSEQTDYEDRKSLARLLNSGKKPNQAAQELGRLRMWARKWKARYEQAGWEGLKSQSRAPRHVPRRTPVEVQQAILPVRSELEAERENKDSLGVL